MNTKIECERTRIALMASLDGEGDPPLPSDSQHLSTCLSCRKWLDDVRLMSARLQAVAYPTPRVDLWVSVREAIRKRQSPSPATRGLWTIGAIVFGWRTVQLFSDLPLPAFHLLVPVAAVMAAVWLIAGNPLQIETSAPELQK